VFIVTSDLRRRLILSPAKSRLENYLNAVDGIVIHIKRTKLCRSGKSIPSASKLGRRLQGAAGGAGRDQRARQQGLRSSLFLRLALWKDPVTYHDCLPS
jgi:hypothetical protein